MSAPTLQITRNPEDPRAGMVTLRHANGTRTTHIASIIPVQHPLTKHRSWVVVARLDCYGFYPDTMVAALEAIHGDTAEDVKDAVRTLLA
jgi:hypothetical protein